MMHLKTSGLGARPTLEVLPSDSISLLDEPRPLLEFLGAALRLALTFRIVDDDLGQAYIAPLNIGPIRSFVQSYVGRESVATLYFDLSDAFRAKVPPSSIASSFVAASQLLTKEISWFNEEIEAMYLRSVGAQSSSLKPQSPGLHELDEELKQRLLRNVLSRLQRSYGLERPLDAKALSQQLLASTELVSRAIHELAQKGFFPNADIERIDTRSFGEFLARWSTEHLDKDRH